MPKLWLGKYRKRHHEKELIFYLISLALFIACNEEPVGQTPLDNIAPGKVSDINVTNIPGGAYLTYKLPDDEDLLYVKAIYQLKEEENG